jgi:hypothetical protein
MLLVLSVKGNKATRAEPMHGSVCRVSKRQCRDCTPNGRKVNPLFHGRGSGASRDGADFPTFNKFRAQSSMSGDVQQARANRSADVFDLLSHLR